MCLLGLGGGENGATCHPIAQCFLGISSAVEKALLRHIHGFQPVLQDELAVVGLLHAGEDFQQAGFARAVAPDQADFVARGQLERRFVEQRDVPEGEG